MSDSATLLWEVGCEELPAWACDALETGVGALLVQELTSARVLASDAHADAPHVLVGPRRFSVQLTVPLSVPTVSEERRGPSSKAPDAAKEGFARSLGLTPADLVERDGLLWGTRTLPGAATIDVFPEVARNVLEKLKFAKPMRWGTGGQRFVRPVRWIVTLLDGAVVPYELWGVESGGTSRAHRFLGDEREFAGFDAAGYERALAAHHVVADQSARREQIHTGLDAAAAALGGEWFDPGHVLDEVVHLVEQPSVITGRFPEQYLDLYPRVLVTAMQSHQRYLPVRSTDGVLRPAFLAVMNGDPAAVDSILPGYERVLIGRLDDAVFSVTRDRERGIDDMAQSLASVVFHAKAGSLADRTERIAAIAAQLASQLDIDAGRTATAARLAKADQVSILVQEFAELEGFAGARYAEAAGYPDDVVLALEQQFQPRSADAPLPAAGLPALIALADKLDLLLTAFAIGEQPTGSRDPHGLRRAAIGVARIVLEYDLELDVNAALLAGLDVLVRQGFGEPSLETVATVRTFVDDRVEKRLVDDGVRVDAVRAARVADATHLQQIVALARTLDAAVRAGDADFHAVLEALTRCVKLVDGARGEVADAVDDALLEPADRVLAAAETSIAADLRGSAEAREYARAIELAATLGPALAAYFDRDTGVLVMADDRAVRANRLRILDNVVRTLSPLGDLTQLQV